MIKIQDIILNEEEIKKCLKFSEERQKSSRSLYKKRGESSLEKIKRDIVIGLMGEIAVSKYFNEYKNIKCSEPDVSIYSSPKKSFDKDLQTDEYDLHVKSQETLSVKRYGNSWLFQKSDPIYRTPENKDLFVFTNVDYNSKIVKILGMCFATEILKNNRWGECKVPSYRHSKIAIYLEDIEDLLFRL